MTGPHFDTEDEAHCCNQKGGQVNHKVGKKSHVSA
jgi:hypothetical protein